jgi:N-acetylneuraminic acid mutarotase
MKNKNLLILLLLGVSVVSGFSQTIPSYVPKTGLVGWWPFNGNANDESGNGNNGTVNGASLSSDRFGIKNSAFSFDGLNDFISTTYMGIAGAQNRTIQFWAKHTQSYDSNKCRSCSYMPIISYGSNVTGPSEIGKGIYCNFNVGATGVGFDGNETNATFNGTNPVNDNRWHHYVYIMENISNVTTIKIYQDGQLLTKILWTYLASNNINTKLQVPLQFGIRTYNTSGTHPSNYFRGEIDDIGFWNRALSTKEVDSLFKSGNSKSCDLIKKACFSVEPKTYTDTTAQKWIKKRNFPGSGRYSKVFTLKNEGYIVGGLTSTSSSDEVWKYIPAKDTWVRKANVPKVANYYTTFAINDTGYAFYDSLLYAYDPVSDKWTQKKSLSGLNLWNTQAFVLNGKGYVVSADGVPNRVYCYDPTTNAWTKKSNFTGSGRSGNVAVTINGKGYYGLGIIGNSNVCLTDWWEYNSNLDTWIQKSSIPGSGRYASLGCTDNKLAYVVGGETSGPTTVLDEFYTYDPATDKWKKEANYGGGGRNYLAGFMINSTLYCGLGGFGYKNDFYQYGAYPNKRYVTYKWSTGDTGLTTCVNPGAYDFVSVTDGVCNDTIFFGWNKKKVTTYDTVLISVKDTLIIAVKYSSTPTIAYNNIKLYPNPAYSHLNIDFNDFNKILGYNVEILNTAGKTVYNANVTQKTVTIDLATWTGKGLYFVNIRDGAGKLLETKKVVLQ